MPIKFKTEESIYLQQQYCNLYSNATTKKKKLNFKEEKNGLNFKA